MKTLERKYKTLMGTPTDVPPSKERQYHIDAVKNDSIGKIAKRKRELAKKMQTSTHYETPEQQAKNRAVRKGKRMPKKGPWQLG